MSNENLLTIGVAIGVLASLGILFYSFWHGVNGSLSNARVGEFYNFEYEQPLHGEPERYMAKVLEVHTLTNDSIQRLNAVSRYRKHDPEFVRTPHLITAQTMDGKIRNFYAERTRNVRRIVLGGRFLRTAVAALY